MSVRGARHDWGLVGTISSADDRSHSRRRCLLLYSRSRVVNQKKNAEKADADKLVSKNM